MELTEMIYLIGGITLTIASVPQIVQVIITKSVRGLNLATFMLLLIGNGFKLLYAIDLLQKGISTVIFLSTGMSFLTILILVTLITNYKYWQSNCK
jgi:uncharacterized protein with PQ loop repeat